MEKLLRNGVVRQENFVHDWSLHARFTNDNYPTASLKIRFVTELVTIINRLKE